MTSSTLSTTRSAEVNLGNALEDRGLRRTTARTAVTDRIEGLSDAFTAEQLARIAEESYDNSPNCIGYLGRLQNAGALRVPPSSTR
jgi:hypothetical protein